MNTIIKGINLTKKYKKRKALDKVSLNLSQGDIYGLIGKNGAGKTTLIKIIMGLAHQNEGTVEYSDIIQRNDLIGLTLEEPGILSNLSALQHFKAKAILIGCETNEIEQIIKLVDLQESKYIKVKNFSMGMKQRLVIGLALLGKPKVVFFDEPINGLDPQGIRWFRELILKLNKEQNITFMISSHILTELHLIATRYGILDNGKLLLDIRSKDLQKKCTDENINIEDFYLNLVK